MARNVSGITIQIDGDTTKLQESLKKVDGQLKTTQTELKNVERRLKLNPSGTELLRQKQKDLQTAIKQTEERLKMLKEAQSKVAKGSEEWDTLQREINDTESDLQRLEDEYRNFGSVAAQQIKQVGEEMQKIGGKMQEVGKDMTRYVTLPIVAAGTAGVKKFAEVDKTMQLTNKTMGNTADEAAMLNTAMEQAAANSIFGMNDAATATLNFARAGLNAQEAADALAPAMNLAAGEGGNLDTVSQGLVGTINGFQDEFSSSAHYADVFAAACNNSALDIDSLSSSMSTAAPIFSAAGYKVEDAALYMGVMANNGIEANEAANSLKTGLSRLISPAKEGAVWMEKLGIEVTNADGSMKDTVTIQRELHDSFGKLSESEQIAAASAIFGKNQMSKWLALINTAPEDVEDLNKSLQECKGTTDEMSDAMMGGFGGSIEKLKSSLDVLMTSIGRLIAEYLQPVIEKVQGWIDKFNALDDSTKKTIIKIAGIVAAIGPLLIVGGKLITGIGMLLTFAPMLGGAFLPVIAIIGVLIAIGVLLWKNWDKIKAVGQNLVETTKAGWNQLKTDVSAAVNRLKTAVVNAWNNIKTTVTTAAENVRASVTTAWENMKTNVSNAVNNVKTSVTNAWSNIKTSVTNAVNTVKSSVSNAFNSIKSTASSIWSSIYNTISSKINAAKSAVTNAIQRMKDAFNFTWSLPHLNLPHISVTGGEPPYGIGGKGSLPQFNIEWYRKAYDNPVLFKNPTVMATPTGYKGFGDGSGAEIVMGLDKLRELVGSMGSGNVEVHVYLEGDARQMFKVVRQTNNTRTKATNYNALAAGAY